MSSNPSHQSSSVNPLGDNIAPSTDSIDMPVTPEILVSRLGDYLIEKNLLTTEQLQQALNYQKANAIAGNPRLLGQILVELRFIDRATLDQIITEQILKLQTALKTANKHLEQRVKERTHALQHRLTEIRAAAEITRLATRATHLDELLSITVNRIVEQFEYYYAAIFLLDHQKKFAVLSEATGSAGRELKERNYKLAVGSRSVIGWVTANNKPHVVSDTSADGPFLQDELLPQTRSEACIPLSIGEEVLGVLDVQSTESDAFDEDDIVILQTLADQIASSIRNVHLLENTRVNLQEINLLYEASHKISQMDDAASIMEQVSRAFAQTSFHSATLLAENDRLRLVGISTPKESYHTFDEPNYIPYTLREMESAIPRNQRYLLISNFSETTLPAVLIHVPREMKCEEIAYLPLWRGKRLATLYVLGTRDNGILTPAVLQPYVSLIEFASVALEKIDAILGTQEQVSNLSVINTVGQVLATETDLNRLYSVIHREVSRVMGDVAFYIAIYSPETQTIQIPYLYEDGKVEQLDPIPLGEGLTSIVIREKKPLMLVEDTEHKALELGAKQHGKLAKSWLGVPLMVGGEVIGVLNVQDTKYENAFDHDDLMLLNTLAPQVAIAIRNASLIAEARTQTERERLLYAATEKVRASLDIQTILDTASQELSRHLGARRVSIKLHSPEISSVSPEPDSADELQEDIE